MSVGIFFGSTTGNTEDVADMIYECLSALSPSMHNIADEPVSLMENYTLIICGIPTWDYGELQADWDDIWNELDDLNLQDKQVAIFGCGDQVGYPEWYQDAIGMLHDKLCAQGAKAVGYTTTVGYAFEKSKATTNDQQQFVGLALDEDNQHELTQQRVNAWCQTLIEAYAKMT